jgi:hypothetical protein
LLSAALCTPASRTGDPSLNAHFPGTTRVPEACQHLCYCLHTHTHTHTHTRKRPLGSFSHDGRRKKGKAPKDSVRNPSKAKHFKSTRNAESRVWLCHFLTLWPSAHPNATRIGSFPPSRGPLGRWGEGKESDVPAWAEFRVLLCWVWRHEGSTHKQRRTQASNPGEADRPMPKAHRQTHTYQPGPARETSQRGQTWAAPAPPL